MTCPDCGAKLLRQPFSRLRCPRCGYSEDRGGWSPARPLLRRMNVGGMALRLAVLVVLAAVLLLLGSC